jgi:hypothetical protein
MNSTDIVFENEGYLINRENRCCKCGQKRGLTKHHMIPVCYAGKLKDIIKEELKKDHIFYYEWDYCCLCRKCHTEYESEFGDELHKFIWDKYNIDLKETSYRNLHSTLPKPSEMVMNKIKTKKDYLKLREICTEFFIDKMKPMFSLL